MIDLGHKRVRCAVLAAGFGIVCTTVATTSAVAQELAADLPEVDIHCPEAIGNSSTVGPASIWKPQPQLVRI